MNEFTRLEQFAKLQQAPKVKFTDLEAAVNSRITYNILPMKVRVDYFPVTDASVLTYITAAVRQQGPAVPAEGGRAEGYRQYLRPHHHHDPPHGGITV